MRRRWQWDWDEEATDRAWDLVMAWLVGGIVWMPLAIATLHRGHPALIGWVALAVWLVPLALASLIASIRAIFVLGRYLRQHPPIHRVTEPVRKDLRERDGAG